MATKPVAKAAPKKAMPVRGQRTATNQASGIINGQPYKPSPAQKKEEQKWRAQDDLRTLQRAAEVKADPGRVKMAQAEAQAQMKALQTVTKK